MMYIHAEPQLGKEGGGGETAFSSNHGKGRRWDMGWWEGVEEREGVSEFRGGVLYLY